MPMLCFAQKMTKNKKFIYHVMPKFLEQLIKCLTFNVDPDGQRNIVLPNGREEGGEMDQPVDSVGHHDFLQVLEVQDVGEDERS